MIDNIAKDCVYFLGLASIILFGFSLALHVLFRGVLDLQILDEAVEDPEQLVTVSTLTEANWDAVVTGDVERDFGSFQDSLVTLFYALLGNFEPEAMTNGST